MRKWSLSKPYMSSNSTTGDSWLDDRTRPRLTHLSVFDIPTAVPRKKLQAVDHMFEEKKRYLAQRLPIYTIEQIARHRLPHYVIFLHQLHESGFSDVVRELQIMMTEEEDIVRNMSGADSYTPFIDDPDKLEYVAEQLVQCSDLLRRGKTRSAIRIRNALAELVVEADGYVWLAKHLYSTSIELADSLKSEETRTKIQSGIHCILGYLELDEADRSEAAFEVAMRHLEESRRRSRHQSWLFESRILILKIKKPVCLYGLREDYAKIYGHSTPIHSIATLLMYKVLSMKASAVVFSSSSTPEELATAEICTNKALRLAGESQEWVAVASAYVLLRAIYLKRSEFQLALDKFMVLEKNADLHRDYDTKAIALNTLGCCYLGLKDPVRALEYFTRQLELCEEKELADLAVDALENIGQVLIAEGYTVEAEASFFLAKERLKTVTTKLLSPQAMSESNWVRFAMSAGLNNWSRLANLCRREEGSDLDQVKRWKGFRQPMKALTHLNPTILSIYPDVDPTTKMVNVTESNIKDFFTKNKKLLDRISHDGVPFGEIQLPGGGKTEEKRQVLVHMRLDGMKRAKVSIQSKPLETIESDILKVPYASDVRSIVKRVIKNKENITEQGGMTIPPSENRNSLAKSESTSDGSPRDSGETELGTERKSLRTSKRFSFVSRRKSTLGPSLRRSSLWERGASTVAMMNKTRASSVPNLSSLESDNPNENDVS